VLDDYDPFINDKGTTYRKRPFFLLPIKMPNTWHCRHGRGFRHYCSAI